MGEKHSKGIESIKSYNCPECDYTTNRSYKYLELHMMKHSDERPFVCDLCEYSAKTRGNLLSHLRSHTTHQ